MSLGLHAALLAGLLLWFREAPPHSDASDTGGSVELVLLEQQGAGATTTPPEPAPAIAAPAPAPEPEPEPVDEALPLPPIPPPSAPSDAPRQPTPPDTPRQPTPPVQRAQEAPQINIGGNNSETDAIVIAGPHVIPASVDAKFRNREPTYPPEAVRRAEQGAVILLIHVSPAGLPAGVDIAESSGFVLLDRAAREAVWDWHFLPAVQDGRPIPFDMKLRVVFHLD